MRKLKRVLAVLLTVLTITGSFSCAVTVFAEDYNDRVEETVYEEVPHDTVAEETEKSEIIREVREKRNEYSKTYKRADGSYTTVVSQTPIHELKDGVWEEIDNTLKAEGEVFKNTDGSFDIEFPKTISESEKITVTNNGESIAFSVNGIENSSAVVATPQANETDIIEKDLSKTIAEITYEAVDEKTDIQYVVSSGFVKENIIVAESSGLKDTYSFEIDKGNLNAVIDENNNLNFINETNEIVFTIPAPVMTDAANGVSYDIDVTVENSDKAVMTLIYTPSKEWLNDNERVYPVIIDPVIMLPDLDDTLIEDTAIINNSEEAGSRTTNYSNRVDGYIANTQEIHGEVLVKINLDTFAFCRNPNIEVTDFNYFGTGLISGGNVLVKPINGSWDCDTIVYDDAYPVDGSEPAITYEDKVIDYFTGVPQTEEGTAVTLYFNITELFKEWITGERENNGFAIVPENGDTIGLLYLAGDHTTANSTYTFNTYFSIDYVDAGGKNDVFECLTQEIGRAGTVNVNAFTRGLSLCRSDIGMSGNIMPVNVNFNYCGAFDNFLELYASLLSAMGEEFEMDLPYGNGWLPSYLQAVFQVAEDQYQVFVGDGAIAVFNREEETTDGVTTVIFIADDTSSVMGYELELIDQTAGESPENFKLISPAGETTYFNETGFIREIYEAEANSDGSYDEITVEYDSDNLLRIDYISDGVGRKYDFVYDEETGLLSKINCLTALDTQIKAGSTETDMCVTYSYDSDNNLVEVTYADGKYITYDYENGNLVKVINIDDYNIEYTYDSLGKVTMITEMSGSTAGNSITLTALNDRQVKITDEYLGTEVYQFGKDGKLHYIFDDKGNYHKSEYSQSSDESVISSYDWKVASENLLKNGSFEETSSLDTSRGKYWSEDFEKAEIDNAYNGNCAYLISSDSPVTKYTEQTVNVLNPGSHTLSAYVKSDVTGELTLKITAIDSNNETECKSTVVSSTEEWERYSLTYTPSSDFDPVKITVGIGFQEGDGTYYVDCVQLESGKGTAEYNLIENGSFNNSAEHWNGGTVADENINGENVNAAVLGGGLPYYSLSEEAYILNDYVSTISQTVKLNGAKGDIYSVGGWFKGLFDDNYINPDFLADYTSTNTQPTNSLAQLKVSYSYTQASQDAEGSETEETVTGETVTEVFTVDFVPHNDGWQYVADSFALKADVESVDVTVIAKNITTDSYVTGLFLTKDSDSELVEEDTSTDDEETDETCSCGCEDCAYGENCPCTGAINEECQCPECLREETSTQDSFGNTLSNKSIDGVKYIETLSSYTADGNYLATYTDECGNITTYDYNTLNGILESVISPIGTENETSTTSYEYDEMGNVVSVSTTVSSTDSQTVEYVYTNDKLTGIITPNGKFSIIYDAWGQVLSVNVVVIKNNRETNIPLVQYTYGSGAQRSQVASVTYTNSSTNKNVYRYTYENGTVVKITLNQTDKHNISYDNLGALTKIENVGGRTVCYDDESVTVYNSAGTLVYQSLVSEDGLTKEENYGIEYKELEGGYTCDSSTGSSTQTSGIEIGEITRIEQNAVTDWFGREASHTTTLYNITNEVAEERDEATGEILVEGVPATKSGKITTQYEYPEAEDGKTSSNIEKYINTTYTGNSESVLMVDGYYYEYDNQNKISAEKTFNVSGSLVDKCSYEYDKLGQLVRYNDAVQNKTYIYTYDSNGNILTKTEYAYTLTDELGTALNTVTYGYDTQWKDKLTNVGDQTITYDNLGNPTSYMGATLTWEGRDLISYETEETLLQYEYDENGMRYRTTATDKDDGQVSIFEYVWVDSKLISTVYTTDEVNATVKYLYNDFDEPVGMVITEDGSHSTYLYLKNAQGDITHIVDSNGKLQVSYTYDAWGKRNVKYHSDLSTTIGLLLYPLQLLANLMNPFGYRGYCYDSHTGLYYLQSRYYDTNTGRFINADDTNYLNVSGTVLGCNLFAYCENDPVNNVDPGGRVYYNDNYIKQVKLIIQRFLAGLLKNKQIKKMSNITVDENYMLSVDVWYYNSKRTYKKMRLLFGNPTSWSKYKSDYYMIKHGATMEVHTEAIMDESNKLASFDTADDYNRVTVISSSAILTYTLIDSAINKSTITQKMNKASKLYGSRYYLFKVSKELIYNGWYAYNVDSREVKKI